MLPRPIRRHWRLAAGGALVLVVGLLGAAVVAMGGSSDVVVYNGRSQYGDEPAFRAFEERTGLDVELRGGTAPELFERLRGEGPDTPADLLVTTDLANLWRAEQAGLLQPVDTPALQRNVPRRLRDAQGTWWGMSLRVRTMMRSTERVKDGALETYADLGDRRWRGRLCLRTSNNEYNQSLVADMLAKRGEAATTRLLRSWMANEPQILGSDVDVLKAIASGRCDVGLTNHYYLARELADDPRFPVAPAWAEQDGAGAHANVSGVGLVRGAEHREDAVRLMESLTGTAAQETVAANGEFAANPTVAPARHIREWAEVETDTIDVEEAGRRLPDAVALMQQVGWK
jgi:iron(III) transport system substrate-binding protein